MVSEQEPSGLDALATAAVLGDTIGELGESSTGPTTRHPRHRPGCTCIVCIQPPSGKGKHKPNCFCNVCLTVKRRFKTLMLRKKKRLSDREAELAQKSQATSVLNNGGASDGIINQNLIEIEVGESFNKGGQQLDLNCDPDKEEEIITVDNNVTRIPLEWKNVLTGLVPCSSLPNDTTEIEGDSHPPVERQPLPPSTVETVIPMDVTVEKEIEEKVVEDLPSSNPNPVTDQV